MKYSRLNYDFKCSTKLLPLLKEARVLGLHRLDDLLAYVRPRLFRGMSRTALYRAMVRLRELGLDPGPDDLSTARRLGRPTRIRRPSTLGSNPPGYEASVGPSKES